MKEKELEDKIHFLEKEIGALEDGIENGKLTMKGEVDKIMIELESIKSYLKEINPDFKKKFPEIKKKITLEKNPEWISDDE